MLSSAQLLWTPLEHYPFLAGFTFEGDILLFLPIIDQLDEPVLSSSSPFPPLPNQKVLTQRPAQFNLPVQLISPSPPYHGE